MVAYIGPNQGNKHIYVVTRDTGYGLNHGVIAGRLIADQIGGTENVWTRLYSPQRLSPLSTVPFMLTHDVQINTQYNRFIQSDITDIEDLAPGHGGVLNSSLSKPIEAYKDEGSNVHEFSALCLHLKEVVCWNHVEKSWDCPIHGNRFSKDEVCVGT